jgi:hypothetical protein
VVFVFLLLNTERKENHDMKKKLVVKPTEPDLKCCKICVVRAGCSLVYYDQCPEAWSELSKDGLGLYWPIELESPKKDLMRTQGYSEEDIDFIIQISKIIKGIRDHKLTIRPATKRDKNVVKFVVTEYD